MGHRSLLASKLLAVARALGLGKNASKSVDFKSLKKADADAPTECRGVVE